MQITFCGAAGTVTGSCYFIETETKKFLIDCGMFQGGKEIRQLNRKGFLFAPNNIDFVLLSHAHIDHAGLLPLITKNGFKGSIYATKATTDISKIVLPDSAHIQEMEAEWRQRKNERRGLPYEPPLYTLADAQQCLSHFQAVDYNEFFSPCPEITVRFLDAGHILGSAMIEIYAEDEGNITKLVFSGDIGQKNQPIIRDPSLITEADYILIESTYGNRLHEDQSERLDQLKKIILEAIDSGGNLVIPAFAVGRTQDLLYHIKTLQISGAIPKVPVYIDSPMAVSITEIYRDNPQCYDEPTRQLFKNHESPFEFPNLHFIRTAEESKRLNATAKGAIIISANGMCEAGRILHHLKHNLWRPESHILFVGYQAEGTLGRRLLEGASVVKIMGEAVSVRARIHSIGGFSAHADQQGLVEWLSAFKNNPRGLFIVHGENDAQQELAAVLRHRLKMDPLIPRWGERFALNSQARLEQSADFPGLLDFKVDQSVADLEHSVMNLRNRIRNNEYQLTAAELEAVQQKVSELARLIKNSA